MAELTLKQINECAREAQIAFCLDKYPSFEVALARKVEAALAAPTQAAMQPSDLHVCPRHDFDIVPDPSKGCEKCNSAAPTQAAPAAPVEWGKQMRAFLFREYNKEANTPAQIARQREIGALLDSCDRKPK